MEKRKQHASAGALANFLTGVESGQEDQRGACLAESIERILEGQRLHELPDFSQKLATLDVKLNEIYADMGYLLAAKYSILTALEKQMQAPDASQEDKNAVILAAIPDVVNDLELIQDLLTGIGGQLRNFGDSMPVSDITVYVPNEGHAPLLRALSDITLQLPSLIAALKGQELEHEDTN